MVNSIIRPMDNPLGFDIDEGLLIGNPIRFGKRILKIQYPIPDYMCVGVEESIFYRTCLLSLICI